MKTFKIHQSLFWQKCGYPYEDHPFDRMKMIADMGLKFDKNDDLFLFFHIIDEHKFFLAKIKYGI